VVDHPDTAVAFADLVGYTAATEAHGDDLAVTLCRRLAELTTDTLQGETELVKTVGDAVMLSAPEAADLLGSITNLLAGVLQEPDFPLVRVGAHLGPVVRDRGDLFGAAVNLAARIVDEAAPMQVLITRDLYERLGADAVVTSLGPRPLRNVSDEVELLELDLGYTAGSWFVDPVCRMRIDHPSLALVQEGVTFHFCSERCRQRFITST
jgi:adenylate cyclase